MYKTPKVTGNASYWHAYRGYQDTNEPNNTTKDWGSRQLVALSEYAINVRLTNTVEFAQALCHYFNTHLNLIHNIKEKQIIKIDSPQRSTNKNQETADPNNLKALAVSDLVANLNIDAIPPLEQPLPIIDTENQIAYEIVILLAMLKLKAYFIDDFNKVDKKLLNKILANIINKLLINDKDLIDKQLNTNNKQDDLAQSIKNMEFYDKKFATMIDIIQKQIDLSSPDSDSRKLFNIISNIPVLKELTLDILVKATQEETAKNKRTTDNYQINYTRIVNLVNSVPIDNWIEQDPNINLQILAKQSLEFIMFSILSHQQLSADSRIYIKSDEFYLYILLHIAGKKINHHMKDFKNFIKINKIDSILDKPTELIKILESTIDEIKNEIEVNVLNTGSPKTNKTEAIIDKAIIDHTVKTINTPVKLTPTILTIPDMPIIFREISKNKRATKRGYGENLCPCGSGKKLRDCCGKNRQPKEE